MSFRQFFLTLIKEQALPLITKMKKKFAKSNRSVPISKLSVEMSKENLNFKH